MKVLAPALLLTLALLASARGGENPRAARSVHLAYRAPAAVAFYNEVTVDQTVPGSYFMVCGFSKGYFGIQDLGGGRKIALFSVWDAEGRAAESLAAGEQQVKVLSSGSNVMVRRFGGEGTGAQSMRAFDWQCGQPYRFLVTAETRDHQTTFRGQLFDPAVTNWVEMAAFRTHTGASGLRDVYSFVEDFRRDGRSVQQQRLARFRNAWVMLADGTWKPVTQAAFSADGNVHTNIDAGATGDTFHLATGGTTTMSRALWSAMTVTPSPAPPPDLPVPRT